MNRILFLSSDPVLKEKNIEIMKQNGLDTVGISACLDALIMLDKKEFDLVVIDDELSDVSGFEACLKVRQQSDVPIILLGSVADTEVWSKVEELGFDLYFRKPVSPRELLARVKALLRRPAMEKKTPSQSQPVQQVPQVPMPQHPQQVQKIQPEPQPVQQAPTQPQPVQQPTVQPQLAQQVPPPMQSPIDSTQVFSRPSQVPWQQQYQQPSVQQVPSQVVMTPPPLNKEPVLVPPLESGTIKPAIDKPTMVVAQQPAAPTAMSFTPVPIETGINVLEDPRIVKLIDALVNGKLGDITPTIDFSYKYGYAYPSVDSLLDTTDLDTVNILESLTQNGILIKQPFEKFNIDPDGQFQLVPTEHCPRDDSSNLIKGQLIEHFSCGYVGLDKDFKQDSRYICPKCHKDLRLIGTDYRNIGIHYRCQDDGEIFTTPVIKWRNLKTRKEWNQEELKEMEVYSYRFSPDKKGWLEFQLKPKTQLVDFLRVQGYQVQELAQLTGKSGAIHTFDILAIRDDILTKIILGVGILVAGAGESEVGLEALFRFDSRAYDIGINYKVVIAIPKLGAEGVNFANRQMIRAFEAKTMAAVVSDITSMPSSRISLQSNIDAGYQPETSIAAASANVKTAIVRFLRNRGYEVFEQALIAGKSGIEHVFDIFARRDDRIIVPTLAIGITSSSTGRPVELDEISRFDAAAFDSGIRNKVFIAIPQISVQARQFAKQQKIDIIEQNDLGKLL